MNIGEDADRVRAGGVDDHHHGDHDGALLVRQATRRTVAAMIPATGIPTVIDPELGGPPTAPTAGAPISVGKRSRFGRLVPNIVLIVSALFFVLPLLSLARYALQNVPTSCSAGARCSTSGRSTDSTLAFDDDDFWTSLQLTLKLAIGTVVAHDRAVAADRDLGAPTRAESAPARRVPHRAAVRGPGDRARRRHPDHQAARPLVPQLRLLARSRSTSCSRCRSRTARSTPALKALDLRTLVDASRSLGAGCGHDDAQGAGAEPARGDHLGVVPDGGDRDRRVHDRRHAADRDAAAVPAEVRRPRAAGRLRARPAHAARHHRCCSR